MVVQRIDEECLEFDIKIFVKEKVTDFADFCVSYEQKFVRKK